MPVIQYAHPEWAVGMLAIPLVLYGYWKLARYRADAATFFIETSLHPDLLTPRSPFATLVANSCRLIALMLAVLALMEPWIDVPRNSLWNSFFHALLPPLSDRSRSSTPLLNQTLLILDSSASMEVADEQGGLTRFARAKALAESLVLALPGELIGLSAATTTLFPVVPPTVDFPHLIQRLRTLSIGTGGTKGTDLLAVAKELSTRYWIPAPTQRLSVVWFTDGEATASSPVSSAPTWASLFPTNPAVSLFVVALGTVEGGEVPGVTYQGSRVRSGRQPESLQALITSAQGTLIDATAESSEQVIETLAYAIQSSASPVRPYDPAVTHRVPVSSHAGYSLASLLASFAALFGTISFLAWRWTEEQDVSLETHANENS